MISVNTKKSSIDDLPLRFGKHKGKTPNQLFSEDPRYLLWMINNFDNGVPFTPPLIEKVKCITKNGRDHGHDPYWNDIMLMIGHNGMEMNS